MHDAVANMALTMAVFDHRKWMLSLWDFIKDAGGLTDLQVSSSKDCNFGQWLGREGVKKFGKYPEMTKILALHEKVHQLGKKIVKCKHDGAAPAAEQLIVEELRPISKAMIDTIENLKNRIS